MRRINRCLNKQLVDICQRSMQLDDLNNKLLHYLPEHLLMHCKIGSFNKGCLLITTDNAIWATELRYCIPKLRDDLRIKAGLYQLSSIKIQITTGMSPETTIKTEKPIKPLSSIACEAVRNTAELCSYEPLKAVLLSLAEQALDRKPS